MARARCSSSPPPALDGGVLALAFVSIIISAGVTILIATTVVAVAWREWMFIGFFAAVAFAAIVPFLRRRPDLATAAGLLCGAVPAFYAAFTHQIDHWDDFWTWLPNALHIAIFGMLPTEILPPVISKWPGYPPASSLLLASFWRTFGVTAENAGPVVNVLALLTLAGLVWRVIGPLRQLGAPERFGLGVVTALAIAVCNPGLDWHWVRASLPETLTLVAFACAFLVGAEMTFGGAGGRRVHLLAFAALLTLIVLLKQTGPILVFILGTALCAVAWIWFSRTSMQGVRFTFVIATLCLPAIALWACWKFYLGEVYSGDEFILRSPAEWHWFVLPQLVRAIAETMIRHWLYFIPIAIVVGRGWLVILRRIFRGAGEDAYADRLAALFALVETAWLAFLTACYLGALSAHEASFAAEFFRYQAHVGGAGLVAAVALAATWLPHARPRPLLTMASAAEIAILAAVFPSPALYASPGVYSIRDVLKVRSLGEPVGRAIAAAGSPARVEIVHNDHYLTVVILNYSIWSGAPRLVREVADRLVAPDEIVDTFTQALSRSDYAIAVKRVDDILCAAFARRGEPLRALISNESCTRFYDELDGAEPKEEPSMPLSGLPRPSATRSRI
jgi:hypothetical protein